jgi:hypothetical protein
VAGTVGAGVTVGLLGSPVAQADSGSTSSSSSADHSAGGAGKATGATSSASSATGRSAKTTPKRTRSASPDSTPADRTGNRADDTRKRPGNVFATGADRGTTGDRTAVGNGRKTVGRIAPDPTPDTPAPVVAEAVAVSGSRPNTANPLVAAAVSPTAAPTDFVSALLSGLQRSLFNQTPTARPVQNAGQSDQGVVSGSVGAVDADGDPLDVQLATGPARGTVTVGTDGSFVYTPSDALATSGGTDSFTVVVRETNAGEHLHGAAGVLSAVVKVLTLGAVTLDDGSTLRQTVTVSIAKTGEVVIGGGQQRGFAMPTWQIDGYDGPGLEESLREIKAMGATYVQFVPTWYQQTLNSTVIGRTTGTVSDAGLERAITLAHDLGLEVFLKPHVDLPDPATQPRSLIVPSDMDAWFSSYTTFITHYAEMAQRLGVEEFSVGTELDSLTGDRVRWLKVIQAVRDDYDGTITYAAGWDWDKVSFLDAVDVIGVDAYPVLSTVPTTDVAALKQAWQWVVDAASELSKKYGKKILFTESGYTSQLGTTTNPASWQVSTTPSQEEQAAAYEALLSTFSDEDWWAGVFWWSYTNPPNETPGPLDFSIEGKLAEAIVKQFWGDVNSSTAAV